MPPVVAYTVVLSDGEVFRRCDAMRNWLNNGKRLRLFAAPMVLTPATALLAFTEATYDGYSAGVLDAKFNPCFRLAQGKWRTLSDVLTFTADSGAQDIYGWYITGGTDLVCSRAFDSPHVMAPGNPLNLNIELLDADGSIFCT